VKHLSALFGRLLSALALAGCAVLFAMMLVICLDVLLRNVRIVPGWLGIAWANEATEYALYLITVLVAPWLLRQGQHIRIDIVLRALPWRAGWLLEWLGDALGLVCCLFFVWYGARVAAASLANGSLSIKTLVMPEWWLMAPMPIAFALLTIEFVFRMHRLATGAQRPRDDAVSAS